MMSKGKRGCVLFCNRIQFLLAKAFAKLRHTVGSCTKPYNSYTVSTNPTNHLMALYIVSKSSTVLVGTCFEVSYGWFHPRTDLNEIFRAKN